MCLDLKSCRVTMMSSDGQRLALGDGWKVSEISNSGVSHHSATVAIVDVNWACAARLGGLAYLITLLPTKR